MEIPNKPMVLWVDKSRDSNKPLNSVISAQRLARYFDYTGRALVEAKTAVNIRHKRDTDLILDMASRYYSDALYFKNKGDAVTAFAALNYAHGWLDAGAMLGILKVKNNELFTVD